jgi:hypothetical protein
MLISAVLDSSLFYTTYFNATYGIQAEDFLNGIEKNGLLIVDSENKLQDAIFEQVESLPTKYRQRLQILVEELFKNKRERVVQCCISPNYTLSEDLLDLAYYLKTVSEADVLIVGNESVTTLKSGQKYDEGIVSLSEYHNGNFEKSQKRPNAGLEPINPSPKSEMEDIIFYSAQFNNWVASIVNEDIFASREQLIALLAENSPHEVLEQEFREFFNGYYVLTSELEEYEESVLTFIEENEALAHLKHRISAVETQRKSSVLGREARRMGMSTHQDPQPEIKVTDLSTDEFRTLVHTLGNSRLFVSRGRLVKLMEDKRSTEIEARLRAEFCEFFVCYLELELFLENYDYDPDEGLELRPEFIEELEREHKYIKSGGKMFTLEEVAEELGI